MPRSFLFFAVIAALVVSAVPSAWAAKNPPPSASNIVSCSCTKRPYNTVVEKSATCQNGTYYTACCKKAHPSMDCTYLPPPEPLSASGEKQEKSTIGLSTGSSCLTDGCPGKTVCGCSIIDPNNCWCQSGGHGK